MEAVSLLHAGKLVIIPTDTVYGVAADPAYPSAMDRLFEAKGRPRGKPIALLAASMQQVAAFGTTLHPTAKALAERFWPGPLTLVLPTTHGSLGFRIPSYKATLELLRRAGTVLAVSSANESGMAPALTAAAAAEALAGFVDLALDAGPSPGGVASTVVRIDGPKVEIIREGAISKSEIMKAAASR
jgi:tRNA threonylcarbamoyl adenosine modification protein (Sua5/YciO/YrdC/YwlC family)